MDLSPRLFTQYGDEQFERFRAYWPRTSDWRLLFETKLNPVPWEGIRRAAATYISYCLESKAVLLDEVQLMRVLEDELKTIQNLTPNGLLCPKKEHIQPFNQLHQALVSFLNGYDFAPVVDQMHLPISVRIVAPGQVTAFAQQRPYDTSQIHSDVWAGDPLDLVIMHLPLFGNIQDLGIEFFEMPQEQEESLMRTFSSYQCANEKATKLIPYYAKLRMGYAYFADARLLHRSIRQGAGLRVSLDCRLRLKNHPVYQQMANQRMAPARKKNYTSYTKFCQIGAAYRIIFDESAKNQNVDEDCGPNQLKYPVEYRITPSAA